MSLTGYNVLRESDREVMLERIGASSIDEMLDFIPDSLRLNRPLELPGPISEWELSRHIAQLAAQNETADTHACFLGGGVYDHYIPEVVNTIASRGEFLTAYTPYQPEISQGLLRVLHDFQRVVGNLFDVPVVNCSVYDGATALAESAWMAVSASGISRLLVAESIWPDYREVLEVYMQHRGVKIETIPYDQKTATVDIGKLDSLLSSSAAAVICQYPNRYGVVEPIQEIIQTAHDADCLAIVSTYPTALGVLPSPGSFGADIVCAEGQGLGLPMAGGGPHVGMIGTTQALEDYLPGRLVGETNDIKGEPALALVKQEREQHVRRHKATSHICSNQALMALRVLVYLCLTGETGLRRIATLSAQKAYGLRRRLTDIDGVSASFDGTCFNEFAVDLPIPASDLIAQLREHGFHAGIDISEGGQPRLLIAVTETKSLSDLDGYVEAFSKAIA